MEVTDQIVSSEGLVNSEIVDTTPKNSTNQTGEKFEYEIQPAGMVWAIILFLGTLQEIHMKYWESIEYFRINPSNTIGQVLNAIRTIGMVSLIYFFLRVLIDRKYLSGKVGIRQFWPCYLHGLAFSPLFLYNLYCLQGLGENLKRWGTEVLSVLVVLLVYRIEDSSESPLLQMKPYVYKKQSIIKED